MRRRCRLNYILEPVVIGDGTVQYVRIKATLSFEVHNMTPESRDYRFIFSIEPSPHTELISEVKFISIDVRDCETPIHLNEDDFHSSQKVNATGWITNEPFLFKIMSAQPATVILTYQKIAFLDGGFSNFFIVDSTSGFEWKAHSQIEGLDLFCYSHIPLEIEEGVEYQPRFNDYHWTVRRVLLPYQGLYLAWSKKASQTA